MIPERGLAGVFDTVASRKDKDLEVACRSRGVSFDAVLRILEAGMVEQERVHNGGKPLKGNASALKAWVWWCEAQTGSWVNPFLGGDEDDIDDN